LISKTSKNSKNYTRLKSQTILPQPIDIALASKKTLPQLDNYPNQQEEVKNNDSEKNDIRKAMNNIETPATFRKKVASDIPTHRRKSSNLPMIDLENKELYDVNNPGAPSRNALDQVQKIQTNPVENMQNMRTMLQMFNNNELDKKNTLSDLDHGT
jgi:hypothetical protein